jgi:hypothetical protein
MGLARTEKELISVQTTNGNTKAKQNSQMKWIIMLTNFQDPG